MNELQKLIKLSEYDNPCIDCFFNDGSGEENETGFGNCQHSRSKRSKVTNRLDDVHNCKHWHHYITVIRFSKDDQN